MSRKLMVFLLSILKKLSPTETRDRIAMTAVIISMLALFISGISAAFSYIGTKDSRLYAAQIESIDLIVDHLFTLEETIRIIRRRDENLYNPLQDVRQYKHDDIISTYFTQGNMYRSKNKEITIKLWKLKAMYVKEPLINRIISDHDKKIEQYSKFQNGAKVEELIKSLCIIIDKSPKLAKDLRDFLSRLSTNLATGVPYVSAGLIEGAEMNDPNCEK